MVERNHFEQAKNKTGKQNGHSSVLHVAYYYMICYALTMHIQILDEN